MSPRRSRTQKNVTTACEPCKARRIRCSGHTPCCETCQRRKKVCVYLENNDGRLRRAVDRQELATLREQVALLQNHNAIGTSTSSLRSAEATPERTSSSFREPDFNIDPFSDRTSEQQPCLSPHLDQPQSSPGSAPSGFSVFGTGQLVLNEDGKLHLSPGATFYRPYIPSGNDSLLSAPTASYQDPLSPCLHLSVEDTRTILSLAFDHSVSFGINAFEFEDFWREMQHDPTARKVFYSPFLRFILLGIGWRSCTSRDLVARYYPLDYGARGLDAIAVARGMVDAEAENPKLSTIIGLYLLCGYLVGMSRDQAASTYYSIGVFLAQDFHVHLRCDEQLEALGLEEGCEVDRGRRAVDAFTRINNAWWCTYFARPSLLTWENATQRTPLRMPLSTGRNAGLDMIPFHARLGDIGLQIFRCNHTSLVSDEERLNKAVSLKESLAAWSRNLPDWLQWPNVQQHDCRTLPNAVATHALREAYAVVLCRPYVSTPGSSALSSLDVCISSTSNILAQTRYIRDQYGTQAFPLTMQHILYVAGTMLVIQLSGICSFSNAEISRTRRDLVFVTRVLTEMADIWPIAGHTAQSLKTLEAEYSLS